MAPGVVTWMRGLKQNQVVSITEYRKQDLSCPVAVGRMAIDSDQINDDTKGKAVYTLHVDGDELWAMGSKATVPPLPIQASKSTEEGAPAQADAGHSQDSDTAGVEQQVAQLNLESPTGASQAEQSKELAPEEVTRILRSSLIQAIKDLPPGILPMNSSTFYSTYILPSRPSFVDGSTLIDIKHSSFKTLSHFLKASAQEGLIKNKEQKGDITVTYVFLDHPDVVAHAPYQTLAIVAKKVEAKKEREQAQSTKPSEIVVTELWKGIGNSHLQSFFKAVGKEPNQLYGTSDLRLMVNSYISTNSLPNPRNQAMIRLDPLLNALLMASKENIDELRREDILKRLVSKMQSWYSVAQGERSTTKKGTLTPIQIATKQKQGRKVVTCVTHFENFFIEAPTLAEELKVKCAGSTSVSDLPGKQNALQEVMVQGNHVSIVADVLMSKGVPKKCIEVLSAPKKK